MEDEADADAGIGVYGCELGFGGQQRNWRPADCEFWHGVTEEEIPPWRGKREYQVLSRHH